MSLREMMDLLAPVAACPLRADEVVLARRVYMLGDAAACAQTPFAVDALRAFMGALWRAPPTRCVVVRREAGPRGSLVANLAAVRDRLARAFPGQRVELLLARAPGPNFSTVEQIREAAAFKLFCSAEGSNCIPLLYMAQRGCFIEVTFDRTGFIWTWVGHFLVMLRIPEMGHLSPGTFAVNLSQLERALPRVSDFLRS